VEYGDRFEFADIFRWLPARSIETCPFNRVLQSLSIHSRIENRVHNPFLPAIAFHRGVAEVVVAPGGDPALLVPERTHGRLDFPIESWSSKR